MTNTLTAGVWTGKESTEKIARVKRGQGGTKGRQRRRRMKGSGTGSGAYEPAGAFAPLPHPFVSMYKMCSKDGFRKTEPRG